MKIKILLSSYVKEYKIINSYKFHILSLFRLHECIALKVVFTQFHAIYGVNMWPIIKHTSHKKVKSNNI